MLTDYESVLNFPIYREFDAAELCVYEGGENFKSYLGWNSYKE